MVFLKVFQNILKILISKIMLLLCRCFSKSKSVVLNFVKHIDLSCVWNVCYAIKRILKKSLGKKTRGLKCYLPPSVSVKKCLKNFFFFPKLSRCRHYPEPQCGVIFQTPIRYCCFSKDMCMCDIKYFQKCPWCAYLCGTSQRHTKSDRVEIYFIFFWSIAWLWLIHVTWMIHPDICWRSRSGANLLAS